MKYTIFAPCLLFALLSCRKDYECHAEADDGSILDSTTISCNCYKQTIEDLENSNYVKEDSSSYKISCDELNE